MGTQAGTDKAAVVLCVYDPRVAGAGTRGSLGLGLDVSVVELSMYTYSEERRQEGRRHLIASSAHHTKRLLMQQNMQISAVGK